MICSQVWDLTAWELGSSHVRRILDILSASSFLFCEIADLFGQLSITAPKATEDHFQRTGKPLRLGNVSLIQFKGDIGKWLSVSRFISAGLSVARSQYRSEQ